MKIFVKKHEIGLLFKKGSFLKAVQAGTYRFWRFSRYKVIAADMRKKFAVADVDYAMIKDDQMLMEILHVVRVKDGEIALHFIDGNFIDILPAGIHLYFKPLVDHSFKLINTEEPMVSGDFDLAVFTNNYFKGEGSAFVAAFSVPAGSVGILLFDGKFIKQLAAGSHYFWKGRHAIEIKAVDLRSRVLEISGQELLSQDKVTLRMNFSCQFVVVDPVKAAVDFERHQDQLYGALQMVLREYVSTRKLDELLAEKHEIGRIVLAEISSWQEFYGVKVTGAGVKDIILPGDIRDILNTVLIAEKTALANVITRREETASTRSLLNTAKLMDENQTLFKLKELEYLERICDKVGHISLSSGAGIVEQLSALLGK